MFKKFKSRLKKAVKWFKEKLHDLWVSFNSSKLGLLNLSVGFYSLYRIEGIHVKLDSIANGMMAIAMSAYVNTMIMFSAISSELKSLLDLFAGSPS